MIYINNEDKIKNIDLKDNNYYIVIDFDKTLTSDESVTSWGLTAKSNGIGPDYTEKRMALFNKYRPLELNPTLTDDVKSKYMQEWITAHIELFFEYHLKETALKEAVQKDYLIFRDGAKEFLYEMSKRNVPVIIISAGVGNVIYEFLKYQDCLYDNVHIVSNFIEFENDVIKSIKGDVIHSMNKNIASISNDVKELIDTKDYALLFGDLIGDKKMIGKDDFSNVITVGFLDEKVEENLEFYNKEFDLVCTNTSSYYDVNNILNLY